MVVVFVFDLNDLPLVIKLRAGEDHSSGSGLENTGHNYEDLHTNIASAVFNHDHGSVIQISNSLIGLFALDYSRPVCIVTDSQELLSQLDYLDEEARCASF